MLPQHLILPSLTIAKSYSYSLHCHTHSSYSQLLILGYDLPYWVSIILWPLNTNQHLFSLYVLLLMYFNWGFQLDHTK
ncbi:hypothetical protein BDB01DRAFT_777832 [Pilobolus umbonatus]|nr:hypothetical protein BDB01DRAFT_777832 [Pilobolus umbonatus]